VQNPQSVFAEDQKDQYPLNEEERIISRDLKIEFQKKMAGFQEFLTQQYMGFDFKINRCLLNNCYKDIFVDEKTKLGCVEDCQKGFAFADQFVHIQLTQLLSEFNICMEKGTETKKN